MYQKKGQKNVGCDPADYRMCQATNVQGDFASSLTSTFVLLCAATSKYIENHMDLYTKYVCLSMVVPVGTASLTGSVTSPFRSPNMTMFSQTNYTTPRNRLSARGCS